MARLPGVPTVRNFLRPVVIPAVAAALILASAIPAQAQARGRAVPRSAPVVTAPAAGRAVATPRPVATGPVYGPGARYGYGYGYPYYGYGYPYRPYYPYYPSFGYGFGFTVGFGFGFPYSPWYGSLGYGYGYPYGGYPYPYPFAPYYGYGYAMDVLTASLRLEVKPRDAEVYVDGYRAGTVDNFDGVFQRLRLTPGEHSVVLYLDGFHKVEQPIYVGHGADQNVKLEMVKLGPGEEAGPRPVPPPPDERAEQQAREPRPEDPRRGRGGPPPEITVEQDPGPRSFGVLALNVQPADAEILIDGAPWTIPAGDARLNVQLPAGRHRVEIRKAGFATYTEEVAVQAGRRLALNISLIRVPAGGGASAVRASGGR
jgi:hypothetical protein